MFLWGKTLFEQFKKSWSLLIIGSVTDLFGFDKFAGWLNDSDDLTAGFCGSGASAAKLYDFSAQAQIRISHISRSDNLPY